METAKNNNKNLPVMTQIRGMEVGDKLAFPASSITSIRANLYVYSLMLNRTYRSHVNREKRCIEVIRIE